MCTVLLQQEELDTLVTEKISYTSKERISPVSFKRFFDKPFVSNASFLSLRYINNLLKTFPPVWNCSLEGFEVVYDKEYLISMVVTHDKGSLTYLLGAITYTEEDNHILIKEKK